MDLRLYDPSAGRLQPCQELSVTEAPLPAAPAARWRRAEFLALLENTARHWGQALVRGGGLLVGEAEPARIRLGPTVGEPPAGAAGRLIFLGARYRARLDITPAARDAAARLEAFLADRARALAGAGAAAANPSGLAGYRLRFERALAEDLDWPAALGALLDALRPGALSPGSQRKMIDLAGEVLGLEGVLSRG